MRAIATAMKRYWGSVLMTLVGVFLVITFVINTAGFIVSHALGFIGPGWVLTFYGAVLFGGIALLSIGIREIKQRRRVASSPTAGSGKMGAVAEAIKGYSWSVFLILIGIGLIAAFINSLIDFVVSHAETVASIGWMVFLYLIWIIGGASILYDGITRVIKTAKNAG